MDKGSCSSIVSHKADIKPQGEKNSGGDQQGGSGGQIETAN